MIRLINYLDRIAYIPTLLPPPKKKYALTMQLPFKNVREFYTNWHLGYLFMETAVLIIFFNVFMSLTKGDNDLESK